MIISLIGCTNESSSSIPADSNIPQENLQTIPCGFGGSYVFPANNGRGVYVPLGSLYYFDFETEEKMVMCTQSGCKHIDTSCAAYLDGADSFAEYRGKWYIVKDMDDSQYIQMTEIDPADGTRRVICTILRDDADMIYWGGCSFAYGNGYLYASTRTLFPDGSSEYEELLYLVDLESGECEQIARTAEYETAMVLGASEDIVLLQRYSLSGDMLSEAAYKKQYGQDADYLEYSGAFLEEHHTIELGIYDLESKHYSVIADEENDGFQHSSNYKFCYENFVIYELGDALMLYNLTDNTSRKLLTRENIVNYQLKDGKAIYIVYENDEYRIYHIDLETGESANLKNNGRTDVMQFSISCETDDYFIGIFHGQEGTCWIKKTDFYNDDYSNVKRLT
jgi:hypothetical protein